jgi:hypothetical protein
MKFSFKKSPVFFILAFVAFAVLLSFSVAAALLEAASSGANQVYVSVSILPLVAGVLSVIAYASNFQNPKVKPILMLVSLIIAYLCMDQLLVSDARYAILLYQAVGNSVDSLMVVLTFTCAMVEAVFMICTIVAFAIFACGKNQIDMKRLLKIFSWLMIAFHAIGLVLQVMSFLTLGDNPLDANGVRFIGELLAGSLFAALIFLLLNNLEGTSPAAGYSMHYENNQPSPEQPGHVVDAEATPASSDSEDEKIRLLKTYKKLLDEGLITQEEYERKKSEFLK